MQALAIYISRYEQDNKQKIHKRRINGFIEQENNNNNNGNNQNDLNYQKEQQQQQQRTITTTTNDNNNDNNNRNDFNTIGFACQMDSTKAIASTIAGIHNGKKDHHVLVRAFEGSEF